MKLREWRMTVTAALRVSGGTLYADVPSHIRQLRAELDRLRGACRIILKAFDDGVFVRSTAGDNNPKWAIELLPYIQALNDLHPDDEKVDETRECEPKDFSDLNESREP